LEIRIFLNFNDIAAIIKERNILCKSLHITIQAIIFINPSHLEMLFEAVNKLPSAMFWCDRNLDLKLVNHLFSSLAGASSPDGCLGRQLKDVLPDAFSKEILPKLKQQGGADDLIEFGVKALDERGNLTSFAVTVRSLEKADQNDGGFVGLIQDVSRIFGEEGAIVEEHELLRTVIDILPAFIYAKDSESKFIIANEVLAGFMGVASSDDLIGKTDFDFFSHKYAMKYYCDEQEIIASGKPKINLQESCSLFEGQEPIWLNTTKVPLRDASGNIVGIVGSGFDVSKQKQTSDKLFELQEIVNNSKYCAFLINSYDNWQVQYCSETVEIFGYRPEDFYGNRMNFLELVHPEDVERVLDETTGNFKDGLANFSHEYRIRRKDSGYCWVEDNKHLRAIREDGSVQFQSLLSDVSIRHQIQEERDQMEIQLRQAQKLEAVGQLAAGIAHEINTPIQFISDNLQFLMDSAKEFTTFYRRVMEQLDLENPAHLQLSEKYQALASELDLDFLSDEVPLAIEQSLEGAHRVSDIVKAMKEFSHPGAGEITHEDINQAILTTITVARNEWKYVAELETELDSNILSVPVDIGPVKQTILNLIVNAAHTVGERVAEGDFEKGVITIRSKQKEDSIVIEVEDTGKGMTPRVAERVFDPFFTTKEVGKGTGQGLSMAYDIVVRKHKGKLFFKTKEGEGTTFFMELPTSIPT